MRIRKHLTLDLWYDRSSRFWFACYRDNAGNQIGDAWFDTTRDGCLVFRNEEPTTEQATVYGYRLD